MDWDLIDLFKRTKRKPWSIKRKELKTTDQSATSANGGITEKVVEETVRELHPVCLSAMVAQVGGFVEVGALTHIVINQAGHLVRA